MNSIKKLKYICEKRCNFYHKMKFYKSYYEDAGIIELKLRFYDVKEKYLKYKFLTERLKQRIRGCK